MSTAPEHCLHHQTARRILPREGCPRAAIPVLFRCGKRRSVCLITASVMGDSQCIDPAPREWFTFLIAFDPHTGPTSSAQLPASRISAGWKTRTAFKSLPGQSHRYQGGSSCPSGLSSSGLGPELERRTATLFPNFCLWVSRQLFGLRRAGGAAAGRAHIQALSAAGLPATDLFYPASPDSRG